MIQFLKFIPAQLLGQFVLGFLELSDLVQLDRSTCCRDSQDLINTIFPWCPSLVLQGRFSLNNNSMKWFQRKSCRNQQQCNERKHFKGLYYSIFNKTEDTSVKL